MRVIRSEVCRKLVRFVVIILLFGSQAAFATSDPLSSILVTPGGAGMGFATGMENSPYRDGRTRNDLVPLYLYEGEQFYLHAYRGGLKIIDGNDNRFEVFLAHRFEGFPYDKAPSSLAGMAMRSAGADVGLSYQHSGQWGALYAEYFHDITGASDGNELRLGYNYEWQTERWRLRPHLMLAVRDARLNDYYYGVRVGEATAIRPAYQPGSGVNGQVGLYGAYNLTERWRLLAGIAATRWAKGVRGSPVVDSRLQMTGALGLMYDISPEHAMWPENKPLIVKVMYGRSTDCNLASIMEFTCASTRTADRTSVSALEFGRPFIERLNGWPVDVVGYAGLLHHDERGLLQDFWQADAYMKVFYYGFPWSERVKTRLGMGIGVSYAQKVPFVEQRAQAQRGRNSSKLLNYLDPSIDVSVGDLFGNRTLSETYLGFGVSHRSGIFGNSQLLGNVNGGSNYIYSYLEWKM
ncbi:MAG: MipA/OmpV family protein [Gallionella sp.]|nr:MipA/OmpV family protein [Gallionella sp.]